MTYKAIALDLDGTLTNDRKEISNRNKECLAQAMEQGIHVILASGRPVFGIEPVAKELQLPAKGGYMLAYNGGAIIDCQTGEKLFATYVPKECQTAICNEAARHGVYAITYYENQILAESDTDEYVLKEAFCNAAQVKKVASVDAFVDYPVEKFLVVGVHEQLVKVQEVLSAQFADVLDFFFSQDYFLEVVPKGVAKDVALESLLTKLGVTKEELIACGDGMNDLPMIQYAGLGVAMENAKEAVKEDADYIAPSNEDDGVAHVIEKFITKIV